MCKVNALAKGDVANVHLDQVLAFETKFVTAVGALSLAATQVTVRICVVAGCLRIKQIMERPGAGGGSSHAG